MKKQPKFIAICAPKGGVGKSTLTVLTASWLHYRTPCRVAVVDADAPQHSIYALRNREIEHVGQSDPYKLKMMRQFDGTDKRVYPVIRSTPEDAVTDFAAFYDKSDTEADVVFFDLPGTLGSSGIVSTIASLDAIFIPIKADRMVLQSCLQFARAVHHQFIGSDQVRLSAAYLFWNFIDLRERTPLYKEYEDVIGKLGLQLLTTHIPDRRKYNRDLSESTKGVFRSTLYPPDAAQLRRTCIDELANEIAGTLNLL